MTPRHRDFPSESKHAQIDSEDDYACLRFLAAIFPTVNTTQPLRSALKSQKLLQRFVHFAVPQIAGGDFASACAQLSFPAYYMPDAELSTISQQVFLIANYAGMKPFAHSDAARLLRVRLYLLRSQSEEIGAERSALEKTKATSNLRISSALVDAEFSVLSNFSVHSEASEHGITSELKTFEGPDKATLPTNSHPRTFQFGYSFSDGNFSQDCSTAPDFSVGELYSNYQVTYLGEKLDFGCDSGLAFYTSVNVLLCGGEKVGKSKLALRMLTGEFVDNVGELGRLDRVVEGERGPFHIVLREEYSRKAVKWANVCLVCFSLMDRQSFEYAKSIMLYIHKWGQKNTVLVGCKADQRLAHISGDEIIGLLQGQGAKYVSCSASRGIGILKLVAQLEDYARY